MLYYKATAGCGVGTFFGGLGALHVAHRPRCSLSSWVGRVAVSPLPLAAILSPSPPAAHSLVPSLFLAPSSRPPARPPPRIVCYPCSPHLARHSQFSWSLLVASQSEAERSLARRRHHHGTRQGQGAK